MPPVLAGSPARRAGGWQALGALLAAHRGCIHRGRCWAGSRAAPSAPWRQQSSGWPCKNRVAAGVGFRWQGLCWAGAVWEGGWPGWYTTGYHALSSVSRRHGTAYMHTRRRLFRGCAADGIRPQGGDAMRAGAHLVEASTHPSSRSAAHSARSRVAGFILARAVLQARGEGRWGRRGRGGGGQLRRRLVGVSPRMSKDVQETQVCPWTPPVSYLF